MYRFRSLSYTHISIFAFIYYLLRILRCRWCFVVASRSTHRNIYEYIPLPCLHQRGCLPHTHSFWWYWLIYIERILWSVYKYKRYTHFSSFLAFFLRCFIRRPPTHICYSYNRFIFHVYAMRTRLYKRCAFVIEQKNHPTTHTHRTYITNKHKRWYCVSNICQKKRRNVYKWRVFITRQLNFIQQQQARVFVCATSK